MSFRLIFTRSKHTVYDPGELMELKQYLSITKALSDPSRVRVLMALQNGEKCVCYLIKLLGLAPSTVSRHVAILKQAGLIDSRKKGKWIYYRLDNQNEGSNRLTEMTLDLLKTDKMIQTDRKQLQIIIT